MNPSPPSPDLVSLTPEEEAEIAEYERIVAFSQQVMAGTHPRIKIPAHLLSTPTQAAPSSAAVPSAPAADPFAALGELEPPTGPRDAINFARDYYRDLGVQANVTQDGILRAYNGKWAEFSPESAIGRAKLQSGNVNKVRKTTKVFAQVKEAFTILSDPNLRMEYDAGRIRDRSPPNDRPIARPAPRGGRGGRGGRGRGGRGGGGRRG